MCNGVHHAHHYAYTDIYNGHTTQSKEIAMLQLLLYQPEIKLAEELRATVKSLFFRINCSYKMTTYHTPDAAGNAILKDGLTIDVFIIDTTDTVNAKKISKSIRKNNIYAAIIFISDSFDIIRDFLIFRPSAFLSAEFNVKETERVIYTLFTEQKEKKRYFWIRNRDEVERVPFEEIDYFESINRKIRLHLRSSTKVYEFYGKLDEVSETLDLPFFIRCHQSFLVNLDNVKTFNRSEKLFITFTNKQVPISKRSMSVVTELFEGYIVR